MEVQDIRNASLAAYQQYVKQVTTDRGFDEETVSQKFMLLLEQAGEFARAARKQANLTQPTDEKTVDVNDAAADVFAVLLDICNKLDMNLETVLVNREQKNETRTWE